MAEFNFSLLTHSLHKTVQASFKRSLVVCVCLGLSIGLIVVSSMVIAPLRKMNKEISDAVKTIAQTEQTIDKLKAEKRAQPAILEALVLKPGQDKMAALNSLGYSQEHIAYWQKQMSAFSLMKGVSLVISGRGPSQFKDALKLTVQISAASLQPLDPLLIAQSLDFLQLYGYVDSFDGAQAIVHVLVAKD